MAFLSHEAKQLEILVSSESNGGAVVSQNGSHATIRFDEPLSIPANAVNVELQVAGASIWYTTPNIISGVNNALKGFLGNAFFDTTIPEGLYTLVDLEEAIQYALNVGTGIDPAVIAATLSIREDFANNHVVITISATGTNFQLHLGPGSFGTLLGFAYDFYGPPIVQPIPPPGTRISMDEGGLVMTLAPIDFYLVHCDLVPRGIRVNAGFQQVVAQVLPDGGAGQQTVYQPINPPKCRAQTLAGSSVDRMSVWITDQNNLAIVTTEDPFSVRMIVTYSLPI